jgi:microcystin-dependent protein
MTPYVGEIRIFAGNFAPAGWMFCDGSVISISEYETLFNLIGTTYGGDGQNTFAMPDLRGRLPIHQGTGPGLSTLTIGETGGLEQVTLTIPQIPAHSHPLLASADIPTGSSPDNSVTGQAAAKFYRAGTAALAMNAASVTSVGGSQPHNNMQPYLCVSFIISLYGIYPSPT